MPLPIIRINRQEPVENSKYKYVYVKYKEDKTPPIEIQACDHKNLNHNKPDDKTEEPDTVIAFYVGYAEQGSKADKKAEIQAAVSGISKILNAVNTTGKPCYPIIKSVPLAPYLRERLIQDLNASVIFGSVVQYNSYDEAVAACSSRTNPVHDEQNSVVSAKMAEIKTPELSIASAMQYTGSELQDKEKAAGFLGDLMHNTLYQQRRKEMPDTNSIASETENASTAGGDTQDLTENMMSSPKTEVKESCYDVPCNRESIGSTVKTEFTEKNLQDPLGIPSANVCVAPSPFTAAAKKNIHCHTDKLKMQGQTDKVAAKKAELFSKIIEKIDKIEDAVYDAKEIESLKRFIADNRSTLGQYRAPPSLQFFYKMGVAFFNLDLSKRVSSTILLNELDDQLAQMTSNATARTPMSPS